MSCMLASCMVGSRRSLSRIVEARLSRGVTSTRQPSVLTIDLNPIVALASGTERAAPYTKRTS